jgi:hypothetical protein
MDIRIYLTIYAVLGLYYASALFFFGRARPGHEDFRRNLNRCNFICNTAIMAAVVVGFTHFMDRLWFS